MKNLVIPAALLAALLALTGCGTSTDEATSSTTKLDNVAYTTITDNGLTHGETTVSGQGTFLFDAPLTAVSSKASFGFTFSLTDGGALTLVSYGTTTAANPVAVTFTRSNTSLLVEVEAASATENLSSAFSSVSASGNITMQIDVHNDETPAHILAWTGSDFSESAAVFNSEDGPATPGNGSGNYWGFTLNNAVLESAVVSDPKFVEAD